VGELALPYGTRPARKQASSAVAGIRAGRAVVSKTELLEHLYDYNWEKFSNVIEVYISGLRRKLDDGSSHQLIHTIRGQGYILQD